MGFCAFDKWQLLIMELERCNHASMVKYYDNHISVHFVLPGHGLLTVEQTVPMTNHFRDFAPMRRSIRRCTFSPCRKIEISKASKAANLSANFWSQKLAQTYYQCLKFDVFVSFNPLIPPPCSSPTKDMCHGAISSDMIRIQPQLDQNHGMLEGPVHTRDWEPVTSTPPTLSLVEKVEPVQVRSTLRSRDQQSMWM